MPLYNPQKGASDRYRGSDHTTVTNPEAGDYTLESGKLNWFYDGTSWARRTPVHWGLLYPAESFSEAFNNVKLSAASMLPEIPGDLVAYTADRVQAGSLTYTGRYNGTTWENISGADSSESIYWLDQAVNTVNSRITTEVETLNDSIGGLVIPPDYYAGQGVETTGIGTPFAGMYTTELDKLWFFNGTAWGQTPFMLGSEVVINVNPTLVGTNSVSIGINSNAAGLYATALGDTANAGGDGSVAIGDQAYAGSLNGIAIGESARAETGANAIAIGYNAVATGVGSVALGQGVTVSGNGSFGVNTISDLPLTVAGSQSFVFGSYLAINGGSVANCIIGDSIDVQTSTFYSAAFGINHTLNGCTGSLVWGDCNKASTGYCQASGTWASARILGSRVHSTGRTGNTQPFADNQSLQLNLMGVTTDATPLVLTAAGVGIAASRLNQLTVDTGGSVTFQGVVEACCPDDPSIGASWAVAGRLHRYGNPTETTLSFQTVTPLWNPSNLALTITADDTLKCAKFTFTGLVATKFKVLAVLNCAEIMYYP